MVAKWSPSTSAVESGCLEIGVTPGGPGEAADDCVLIWSGVIWFGLVWCGLAWFGLVWFGRRWDPQQRSGAQCQSACRGGCWWAGGE